MIIFFKKLIYGKHFAQVKNTQESVSVSVGECIATFTSTLTGESLVFAGDSFYNDNELLGDPTMDTDRANRHMSADGTRDVVMQSLSRAGERDVTFLLGSDFDKLKSWAQSRVQTEFDFDFYFKYNTQTAEGARIHRHKRCVMKALPLQAIGREKGYVTCKISFGDLAEIDPSTGNEI
jgi:hypothetical protein